MSGLENIISRIKQDSSAECEKISADAAKRASEIISEAENKAQSLGADIISQAQKKAGLIEQRASSAAVREERTAVLNAKTQLVDSILEKALVKLHRLDKPTYFRTLKLLAEKNALNSEGVMLLNAEDLQRMPADFADGLENIKISAEPCSINDGFILKYGDLEVNCTFAAMLEASRDELKAVAVELLFG